MTVSKDMKVSVPDVRLDRLRVSRPSVFERSPFASAWSPCFPSIPWAFKHRLLVKVDARTLKSFCLRDRGRLGIEGQPI